jgi:hypothetical protein
MQLCAYILRKLYSLESQDDYVYEIGNDIDVSCGVCPKQWETSVQTASLKARGNSRIRRKSD